MQRLAERFKLVLYTPGNHDGCVEKDPVRCRDYFETPNLKLLLHQPYTFEGVNFFGSPWTPAFYDWAFQLYGDDAKRRWAQIPDDTDVLFTHGPPEGIMDSVRPIIGDGYEHAGCPELLKRVIDIMPQIHAFGHIHGPGGQTLVTPHTTFVNAAICNDGYKAKHKPVVLDLPSR